jgi:hypothetical protein
MADPVEIDVEAGVDGRLHFNSAVKRRHPYAIAQF